jgi:hypothetical protein
MAGASKKAEGAASVAPVRAQWLGGSVVWYGMNLVSGGVYDVPGHLAHKVAGNPHLWASGEPEELVEAAEDPETVEDGVTRDSLPAMSDDDLRDIIEFHGAKVDGRWGHDRLVQEAERVIFLRIDDGEDAL